VQDQFKEVIDKNVKKISHEAVLSEASLLVKSLSFKDLISLFELFFNMNVITTDILDYLMIHINGLKFEEMSKELKYAHFYDFTKLKKLTEMGQTDLFSEHFKYGWLLQTLSSHITGDKS
jgi:hypothetical protein